MLKPTLCFALPFEAKPWIKLSGAKSAGQSKQIGFYESDNYDILICGMGSYKMAAAIGWLFGKGNTNRILFNIGLAGSANFNIHNWITPYTVFTNNTSYKPFYPELLFKSNINTAQLLTVDSPATQGFLKTLSNAAVDMEAYAFAKSAQQFLPSTQIHFLKFISDDGADQEIDLNLLEEKYTHNINTAIGFIEKTCETLNRDIALKNLQFKETETISSKLKITFSQKVQLENALRYVYFYELQHRLAKIENLLEDEIKDKYHRNLIFNTILNSLYND